MSKHPKDHRALGNAKAELKRMVKADHRDGELTEKLLSLVTECLRSLDVDDKVGQLSAKVESLQSTVDRLTMVIKEQGQLILQSGKLSAESGKTCDIAGKPEPVATASTAPKEKAYTTGEPTHPGERIKQRRETLKISQVALGRLVGVSGPMVSLWERQANNPRPHHMLALVKHLQTTSSWLNGAGA